jgi:hypothetical protein
VYALLAIGITCIAISAFNASSFLAILGTSMIFWGAILLYITPSKQVPLTFLNASALSNTSNIERILSEHNVAEKGVYLPPKNLTDIESSLIFVPEKPNQPLPKREDTTDQKLTSKNQKGIFLTPLGLALSRVFERELGVSFTKTDLTYMQEKLPKLLIETLGLAENVEIQTQNNTITTQIAGNILSGVCQETRKLPRTHETVGCLLPSAIACALAKATGKPIIIAKEEQSQDDKITVIEYQMVEE